MTSKMQPGETILLQDKTFEIFRRVALIYLCLVILTTLSLCAPLFNSCNNRVIIQSFCTRNLVKNVNLSPADLPADSFLLAIQTRHQQQLFQAFASKVVCMDSTHGTTTMILNLSLSCMVADQFGQGLYCTTLALISEPTYSCIHRQNSWMVHL